MMAKFTSMVVSSPDIFQVVAKDICQDFAAFLQERFLMVCILRFGYLSLRTGEFPHFGEGLNDRDGHLRGLRAFQDRGKHVQAILGMFSPAGSV